MREKSADAFRNIGEMAEALGVRTHILRYWEEHFPMLKPLTRAGGRRLYRPEDVALLHRIHHLLYHEGYTVKGAHKFLANGESKTAFVPAAAPPAPSASAPLQMAVPTLDLTALKTVRDRLASALAAA